MASVASYNDLVNRVGGGYTLNQPIYFEQTAAITSSVFGSHPGHTLMRVGYTKNLPNPLPTGVSSYIPTLWGFNAGTSTVGGVWAFKMINLGSINVGTNTFTDGSSMPTVTELGNSVQIWSPLLAEVTTGLNATPGNVTITYVDQDGNAAEAATTTALTASAAAGSLQFFNNLNSTDVGVKDITNVVQSGGTTPSGVIKFWGVIPVGYIPLGSGALFYENLLTSMFDLIQLGAGDRIDFFQIGQTAAKAGIGNIHFIGNS